MSVYKRGRLYWYEFVWRVERIRQPTKQTNKRVAEQMEAAHKTALAKGEVGIRDRARIPTLRQFEDRFVKAIETDCSDKPSTIEFYKAKLRYVLDYEPLARCRLSSIDEALVDAFKQHRRNQTSRRGKRLSVASVNRELATLRRLLRLAQKWKVIDRVPRIKMLRGEHKREFVLSFEHENLYLEMAPESLRDPAILMLDEGLRVRETRLLEWPDVHLTPAPGARFGYVTIRAENAKNAKKRNLPLTARAVEMLKRRGPAQQGYVFTRSDGRPLYQTWLNQQHSKLRDTLKLTKDFVPHSFRHTYGTRLGEGGADAFTIMKLMGHSTVLVSQLYVHPTPESMEKAVESMAALNPNASRSEVPTKLTTTTKSSRDVKKLSH